MKHLRNIFFLLKRSGERYVVDRGSMLAAALAYYTLFSLAPLMIISIALAEQVFINTDIQLQLISRIRVVAGSQVSEVVRSLIEGFGNGRPASGLVASVISIGVLIFGSSNVFRQLKRALNTVWRVPFDENQNIVSLVKLNLLSFALVLLLGLLLVVAILMNTLADMLGAVIMGFLPGNFELAFFFQYAIPFVMTILMFALLYKVLPDVKVSWRDVWLGAAVTTLLLGIVLAGLRIYLRLSNFGAAYGAAGSMVVLLFMVYFGAQIFLFGAEFTQVFANRFGSRAEKGNEGEEAF